MKHSRTLGYFSCFFLFILSVISFGFKGMMLQDAPGNLSYQELVRPEIYRSLEGLVCIDAFLVVFSVISMIALYKAHSSVLSMLSIILVLAMIGRFVLSVTFLAGDDNFGQDEVQRYYDFTTEEWNAMTLDKRGYYVSLRNAWVEEIINVVVVDVVATTLFSALVSQRKEE